MARKTLRAANKNPLPYNLSAHACDVDGKLTSQSAAMDTAETATRAARAGHELPVQRTGYSKPKLKMPLSMPMPIAAR